MVALKHCRAPGGRLSFCLLAWNSLQMDMQNKGTELASAVAYYWQLGSVLPLRQELGAIWSCWAKLSHRSLLTSLPL